MAVAHTTTCQKLLFFVPEKVQRNRVFSLFMILKGTKFQVKVWKYLKTIKKGQTKTYLDVAKAINKPKSVRAVANAIGMNPYAPKIPCHRVVRSDGSLGGYSGPGGVKTKKKLLKSEGVLLQKP